MSNQMEKENAILKFVSRIHRKLTDPEIKHDKVLKYLESLQKLPISLNVLKVSSIGKSVNKLKKQEGMIGEIARDLIIKWKSNVSPQKIEKIETESRGGEEKAKIKDKTSISLASTSTAVVTNDKDHWKDVSLDLLGEKAIEKSKKKLKSSRGHIKPILEERKKHLIEVRHDPTIPSLPDIKLPEIQRTYRPLHFSHLDDDQVDTPQRKKANVADEDLESIIVSRKSRTQVFSGRRSCYGGVVQSLYNQCMRVLADNIEALEDTGGVPFDILEPLLSKVSPAQLIRLEEFNPYFTEDSGELWKRHCEKEFRGKTPDEMESWRELYLRKCSERSEKLKSIQSKISESQSKKEPMRQAKLAYVAAPPMPIRRKQIKYGTGEYANMKESKAKKLKEELAEKHKNEAEHTVSFAKVPKRDRCSSEARRINPRADLSSKKTASKPMMKAAMKMMKNQRSRSSNQIIRK